MILSCQQVAQLLYEKPQLTNKRPHEIQEQGVVRWCPHTGWGETEETGQVWCGRGPGWWPHIAPGPDPLPSRGHGWIVRWLLLASLLPCLRIPHSLPPLRAQMHIPPIPEEPGLKSQPNHLLVNPSPNSDWGQRNQIPNYPCRCINAEMEKIVHLLWWRELKASGRVSIGIHLIREGLSKSKSLQWAHWQAVAFRLPLVQHEASGWWDAPPVSSRLCPTDFLFHTDASSPRDFWVVRKEKSLALAWALQACMPRVGDPNRHSLWVSARTSKVHGPPNDPQ